MKSREFLPLLLIASLLILASCASTTPAPVSEGRPALLEKPITAAPVATPVPVSAPRGPTYTVKKGDTLYAIALDHGLDYKDLVIWNALENPNLILVDQVLRLSATDGAVPTANGAMVRPIAPPPSLESKPAKPPETPQTGASSPTIASTETLKREPKGGKQLYSPEALERQRRIEAGKVSEPTPVAVAPATTPTPTETVTAAVVTPPAPAPASALTAVTPSAIEWSWPISGAVLGGFSEGSNKGVDIAGKLGEPIGAAAAGKVVYAGSGLRGYGNLVIVRHSADYLSAYAHAREILVKEGQTVSRLQKIAVVGDTDADRPKLHFEVRYRGVPVDPQKHLPAR